EGVVVLFTGLGDFAGDFVVQVDRHGFGRRRRVQDEAVVARGRPVVAGKVGRLDGIGPGERRGERVDRESAGTGDDGTVGPVDDEKFLLVVNVGERVLL